MQHSNLNVQTKRERNFFFAFLFIELTVCLLLFIANKNELLTSSTAFNILNTTLVSFLLLSAYYLRKDQDKKVGGKYLLKNYLPWKKKKKLLSKIKNHCLKSLETPFDLENKEKLSSSAVFDVRFIPHFASPIIGSYLLKDETVKVYFFNYTMEFKITTIHSLNRHEVNAKTTKSSNKNDLRPKK